MASDEEAREEVPIKHEGGEKSVGVEEGISDNAQTEPDSKPNVAERMSAGGEDSLNGDEDSTNGHGEEEKASERSNNEENDDDDEEEEEEEEDEEDDEITAPRRKKQRRERRNQFLDVEAEVDEDEEDLEDDEEGFLERDGFIQEQVDDEEEGGALDQDDRLHREVDRRREAIAEQDAEKLASEYKEKYGRSTASAKYRGDSAVVPQRLLLPSVHDPNIWGVRCKIGKEKELVRAILKKKINLQYTKTPLGIYSAFQRDTFSGYVYIEARKQSAVEQALRGFANVYVNNMILVPIKEYPDMFRVNKSKEQELTPGTYVRIKRGKYAGDLAIVENLSENGLEARLKVVPRLDYGKSTYIDSSVAKNGDSEKRKRFASNKSRPPPRLFSVNDAMAEQGPLQKRGIHTYVYNGDEYENGYLIKDFRVTYLVTEDVNPRLEELTRFNNANEDGIDLSALSKSLNAGAGAAAFQPGELVEVVSGEQTGMRGKVVDAQHDIVTVLGTGKVLQGRQIKVPSANLRKWFSVGDHVRVINGNYKDDTGLVVSVSGDNVTLLSDLSQTEITVFAKDLKAASDIGGSNSLGGFELHALVQINAQMVGCIVNIERDSVTVLAQDGSRRNMSPASIAMKMTKSASFSTDKNGREIREGDTVRETGGERRQGVILHIYRQYIFMLDRAIRENLGVFVNRNSNVETVATKGARDEKDINLTRMNPNAMGGPNGMPSQLPRNNIPRHKIVNKRVTIGRGSQYKGFHGTVRDFNDTVARIELDAKNKIVNVDITKLLFHGPRGNTMSFSELVLPPGRRMEQAPGSNNVGSGNGGGRTPAWNSGSGAGGRTPAWGAQAGGRTPAWNNGAQAGGRTPAWGAQQAGGRTPAWNSGSGAGGRTPAWGASSQQGGRTPAWNPGAKTPAWNANAATPGWDPSNSAGAGRYNSSGSRNAYDSGRSGGAFGSSGSAGNGFGSSSMSAPTPGALNAPTPGIYLDAQTPAPLTAPTPGVYDARTPASAPTPGAWADTAETPKYEASTP